MLARDATSRSSSGRAWPRWRFASATWRRATLYQRFGFRPVGVRPRYYSDNGEDALIMTTDLLRSPTMRHRVEAMADRYGDDWLPDEDPGRTTTTGASERP